MIYFILQIENRDLFKGTFMKKLIALGISMLVLFSYLDCNCNSVSQLFIGNDDEIQMGNNFAGEIEADTENFPLYRDKTGHDEALIDYIDSIGSALINHMGESKNGRDTLPYRFTIIDMDTVVNAFAVPGGPIYIYTGLIKATRNEDEIAGVLAHEIGHITRRHGINRMIEAQLTGLLLDVIVGDSSALRTVLDLSTGFLFLKYSRDNEFQADSCSVEYLAKAGYNPNGMLTFLEYLRDMGGENAWKFLNVLQTHPPSQERMDSVEVLIERNHSGRIGDTDFRSKRVSIP
jgi:predicted Zn-dependent protease